MKRQTHIVNIVFKNLIHAFSDCSVFETDRAFFQNIAATMKGVELLKNQKVVSLLYHKIESWKKWWQKAAWISDGKPLERSHRIEISEQF